MELHPTRELGIGKVLHCKDCGAVLFLTKNSLSATCATCGNIEFVGKQPQLPESKNNSVRAETILSRRLLAQLANALPVKEPEQIEIELSGARVEELIFQYQVEWQLWSAVVEHFQDPNYHMAYISLIGQSLQFSEAMKRYQKHSRVMATLSDSRWQSEICDRQMELLRKLASMQFERELQHPDRGFSLPRSWGLLLSFTAGLILVAHFFAR